MAVDRFVRFDKKKPTLDELKDILECYIKGLGSISYSHNSSDNNEQPWLTASVWFVKLPGKPSFPFKTIYPEMDSQAHEERWFEVWVGALITKNPNIDVITRQADELTSVIADGYAKIVARFFEADLVDDESTTTEKQGTTEMTPKECAELILKKRREMDQLLSGIDKIAKEHIDDFHFMDYAVSTFWRCEKSPIGMCVFKLNERGRKTDCRYCDGPVERK